MIYSLFLAYHIYGMICSFYQLCIRGILFYVFIYIMIASQQKTIYFFYFIPRFLFSLFIFLDFI